MPARTHRTTPPALDPPVIASGWASYSAELPQGTPSDLYDLRCAYYTGAGRVLAVLLDVADKTETMHATLASIQAELKAFIAETERELAGVRSELKRRSH
jgi:hypothetical protein